MFAYIGVLILKCRARGRALHFIICYNCTPLYGLILVRVRASALPYNNDCTWTALKALKDAVLKALKKAEQSMLARPRNEASHVSTAAEQSIIVLYAQLSCSIVLHSATSGP